MQNNKPTILVKKSDGSFVRMTLDEIKQNKDSKSSKQNTSQQNFVVKDDKKAGEIKNRSIKQNNTKLLSGNFQKNKMLKKPEQIKKIGTKRMNEDYKSPLLDAPDVSGTKTVISHNRLDQADKIVKKLSFKVPSDYTNRLRSLIQLYIKDIRDEKQTIEVAERPYGHGGLELSRGQSEQIIKACHGSLPKKEEEIKFFKPKEQGLKKKEEVKREISTDKKIEVSPVSLKKDDFPVKMELPKKESIEKVEEKQSVVNKIKEENKDREKDEDKDEEEIVKDTKEEGVVEMELPETDRIVKEDLKKEDKNDKENKSAKKEFVEFLPQQEKEVSVPDIQQIIAESEPIPDIKPEEDKTPASLSVKEESLPEKPTMQDVVVGKTSVGPVDEIKNFNLVDFRRLSSDSEEAVARLKQKFINLKDESYLLFLSAIDAWKKSPLFLDYIRVIEKALVNRQKLSAVIVDKNQIQWKEMQSIISMEKELLL